MSERIECPYCDYWQLIQDVTETDEFGEPITCRGCGKEFLYTVQIIVDVEAHKAPCLNGEPHDFEPNFDAKYNSKCAICGVRKNI